MKFPLPILNEVLDRVRFCTDALATTLYTVRRQGGRSHGHQTGSAGGYNGDITFSLAVDQHGTVIRMRVVSHQEIPGIGREMGAPDASWSAAFGGRSRQKPNAKRWHLRSAGGDIDSIGGATITASTLIKGLCGCSPTLTVNDCVRRKRIREGA